jgi:CBS domain-containing protein
VAGCVIRNGIRLNVGALAVMDGGRLVGVFSERDVIRKCICRKRRTDETMVQDIMTAEPSTIGIDGSLAEALSFMTDTGFRHLPVLDADETAGHLSMRDISDVTYYNWRRKYGGLEVADR